MAEWLRNALIVFAATTVVWMLLVGIALAACGAP